MAARLSVDVEGAAETIAALNAVAADLQRKPNPADRQCATMLAAKLAQAAAGSGVPVAPRVARSIRPGSGAVSIGPAAGRSGKPSAALAWGSEQGPKGAINHFGVPPSSGYWIRPTVESFQRDQAPELYGRAVDGAVSKSGL